MTNERPRRLRRSADRKIAGVAAGIAEYLDLDPTLARLGFVVVALLGLGAAALGYLVLWVVMPAPVAGASTGDSPAERPSKLLLAAFAVVLVFSLAGGIAWVGVLSVNLLRLSLPVWLIAIVGAYLLMRSRRARAS